MKNSRKIITFLICTAMLCTAFSCGQTEEPAVDEPAISESQSESEESTESKGEPAKTSSASKTDSKTTKTTAAATTAETKPAVSSAVTGKPSASSGSSSGNSHSASAGSDSGNTSQSGGSSSGNASGGSSAGGSSSGSSSSGGSSSGGSSSGNSASGGSQNNSSASNQQPAETPEQPEEKVYTGEIQLGSSPHISGSNLSTSGSKAIITGGGDFHISGSVSDGQLEVNTTEKVKIFLDGVSITNSSGPAIQVTNAKRFTLVLMEGTTSELRDGGSDKINDGAIFSNDTIEIRGKGTLNITAENAHGIASDDDVVIENGNINVTAVKSGIFAHDDITLNSGNLNIQGGTNGIKSKGTINVNGGYSIITGGTKEEKSSVYAGTSLNYTGGYLFAAGNMVTAPASSANPFAVAGFSNSQSGGTSVIMYLNGGEAVNFTPANNFKCVMMLSPDITEGSSFGVDIGGKYFGDYKIAETQNVFTLD